MEVLPEQDQEVKVEESAETPLLTNGSVEEKVRTPCEALPGWTKVVVTRKTGNSAGKSDVYYYSPTGKKVRSKPDMEKLLQVDGAEIDLSKFDYRSGTFVERTTSRKRKNPPGINTCAFGKDLADLSMVSLPNGHSKKLANNSVTLVSNNVSSSSNGLDLSLEHVCNGAGDGVGLVSPRQIYWERQLQNMNGKNGLVDDDIFSETNGEFCSLLHSIVTTLQMERALADKRTPVANESVGNHQPSKKPIKITKADIRKQEKQVIKARRELAKAITEYEAVGKS